MRHGASYCGDRIFCSIELSSATFDCELIIVKSIDVDVGIRLIYVMRCLRNASAR